MAVFDGALQGKTWLVEDRFSVTARTRLRDNRNRLLRRSDRGGCLAGLSAIHIVDDYHPSHGKPLATLSAIAALPDFRRLMRAACLRIGQLLNQTELGRDVALAQATVHRYLNLLEASYLLVRLPAYSVNRTKRLIKAPKLYWGDTGVALHLAGSAPEGAHLENLVLQDLLMWRDARLESAEVMYWRTASGEEVDLVVEAGDSLLPIEIKATARPRLGDAKHLISFRAEYGKKARAGLLLHTGSQIEWLAPDILAAPWWRIL